MTPLDPLNKWERFSFIAGFLALCVLITWLLVMPAPAKAHVTSKCPTITLPMKVKGVTATRHQRRMATIILNVGRTHRASWKVHISALIAATQESGIKNIPYGHGSSVGLFQLIDDHEPSRPGTQRLDPVWVSHWYYTRAKNVAYHHPEYSAPQIAQAVERSGHPGAYRQWVPESRRTWRRFVAACART